MNLDDFAPEPERAPVPVKHLCIAAVALGAISAVAIFLNSWAAVVFGAIGLFLGGFSMSRARKRVQLCEIKMPFVYIAALGLLLSVIGFILGYADVISGL